MSYEGIAPSLRMRRDCKQRSLVLSLGHAGAAMGIPSLAPQLLLLLSIIKRGRNPSERR